MRADKILPEKRLCRMNQKKMIIENSLEREAERKKTWRRNVLFSRGIMVSCKRVTLLKRKKVITHILNAFLKKRVNLGCVVEDSKDL